MRTLILLGLLVVGTGSAQAACVLQPDNAASRYVENNAAYMLCLQRELAANTARANDLRLQQGNFDLTISQLQRQTQLQLQAQQLALD